MYFKKILIEFSGVMVVIFDYPQDLRVGAAWDMFV